MEIEKISSILEKLGYKYDIDTETIIDNNTETIKSTTTTTTTTQKKEHAPVLTNKGKLGVFNKHKKNYIPKGTSSS